MGSESGRATDKLDYFVGIEDEEPCTALIDWRSLG